MCKIDDFESWKVIRSSREKYTRCCVCKSFLLSSLNLDMSDHDFKLN